MQRDQEESEVNQTERTMLQKTSRTTQYFENKDVADDKMEDISNDVKSLNTDSDWTDSEEAKVSNDNNM